MLWHYPQTYSVWCQWQGALCLGVRLHMNSFCCCSSLRTGTLLSICHSAGNQPLQRLTSWSPASTSPSFFLWQEAVTQSYCTISRCNKQMFITVTPSSPFPSLLRGIRTMWQHLSILAQTGGVAGPFCRGWQMDQSASRQWEEMREKQASPPILQHSAWLPNLL